MTIEIFVARLDRSSFARVNNANVSRYPFNRRYEPSAPGANNVPTCARRVLRCVILIIDNNRAISIIDREEIAPPLGEHRERSPVISSARIPDSPDESRPDNVTMYTALCPTVHMDFQGGAISCTHRDRESSPRDGAQGTRKHARARAAIVESSGSSQCARDASPNGIAGEVHRADLEWPWRGTALDGAELPVTCSLPARRCGRPPATQHLT